MKEHKIDIDIVIRNIILQCIAKYLDFDTALKEADLIETSGIKLDDVSYYILLDAAINNKDMENAKAIISKSLKNNTSIKSSQFGMLNINPFDLLTLLIDSKLEIDQNLYAILIHKALKKSDFLTATKIFKQMKASDIKSNLKIYSLWINGLSKFGLIDKIKLVYDEMISENNKPDVMIFSSIFEAITRSSINPIGKKLLISKWLREMKYQKVEKNAFFYNTMFSCYSAAGFDMFGFKYTLGSMVDMQNKGSIEHETRSFNLLFRSFNSVVDLIKSDGNAVSNIVQIISKLEGIPTKTSIDDFKYGSGTFGYDEEDMEEIINQENLYFIGSSVMRWYNLMKNELKISPDGFSYMFLLSCLVKIKQPQIAMKVYRDMVVSLESDQSIIYYVFQKNDALLPSFIEMLFSKGHPKLVLEVWRDLLHFGLSIDSLTIAIMLRSCDRLGYKEMAKHTMMTLLNMPSNISEKGIEITSSKNKIPVDMVDEKGFQESQSEIYLNTWSKFVSNRVMNLYIVLMIKYNQIGDIMPTLEHWRLLNISRDNGDIGYLLSDESSGNEIDDLTFDNSKSGHNISFTNKNSYFLTEEMISNIFKALSSKIIVERSKGKSKQVMTKLGIFIEKYYPNAMPLV
ncbi:Pentatricopeptide repeat-containing protein [Smittium mucronatum]|uniref:Pentatricopeptide repeat-containing protein n=1 Tax=Smittium mucronatum TaxID=133383 RepID=A0A1R0H884_9FUNG|nr:Pentatricopeptide repeat-containing protein [Smittium mucronatum]